MFQLIPQFLPEEYDREFAEQTSETDTSDEEDIEGDDDDDEGGPLAAPKEDKQVIGLATIQQSFDTSPDSESNKSKNVFDFSDRKISSDKNTKAKKKSTDKVDGNLIMCLSIFVIYLMNDFSINQKC